MQLLLQLGSSCLGFDVVCKRFHQQCVRFADNLAGVQLSTLAESQHQFAVSVLRLAPVGLQARAVYLLALCFSVIFPGVERGAVPGPLVQVRH